MLGSVRYGRSEALRTLGNSAILLLVQAVPVSEPLYFPLLTAHLSAASLSTRDNGMRRVGA